MAKVILPLMSKDVSGIIGKSIVFTKAKKENIAKGYKLPKYTRKEKQDKVRKVYVDGVIVWHTLSEDEKQYYINLAVGKPLSGFNVFIKLWMEQNYPPKEIAVYGDSYYEESYYDE